MSSLPTNDDEPVDSGLNTSGYTSSSSSSSSSSSPSPLNYTISYTSNEATTQSSVIPVKEKKKYPCNHCTKFFTRPSALETHNYTHTQEKPFQCPSPNCGRRFSVVSNLRRHFKVHQKGLNNVNKISPQERLHCVRKLIKRNSRNATDQVHPQIHGSHTSSEKTINPQELTSTLRNSMIQPIIVEEDIAQYILDSPMVTEREVDLVLQKPYVSRAALYNVNQRQNVDQLIGDISAYQQPDINTPFAQFDEFNFL